jgi:hypothetical protein
MVWTFNEICTVNRIISIPPFLFLGFLQKTMSKVGEKGQEMLLLTDVRPERMACVQAGD